jgi:hypothetical protein
VASERSGEGPGVLTLHAVRVGGHLHEPPLRGATTRDARDRSGVTGAGER